MSTKKTLNDRGESYGQFDCYAHIYANLQVSVGNKKRMPEVQRAALDMILSKIARIVNGDALYIDSWRDIAGYAELSVQELKKTAGATDCKVNKFVNVGGQWVAK